jgi:hypothetical protein
MKPTLAQLIAAHMPIDVGVCRHVVAWNFYNHYIHATRVVVVELDYTPTPRGNCCIRYSWA